MKRLLIAVFMLLCLTPIADAQVITVTPNNTFAIYFDFVGTPNASQIGAVTCPYTMQFPAQLTTPTSQVTCGTNPGETDAYTVKVASSSQGTITLSTGCVATISVTAAFTCTAGQRLEIDAPATVSGADIAFALAYTRTSR